MHCTDGDDEMVVVANRFYRDDPRPFLLLTLDLERTGSPWRFDDPGGIYPHVYGPIDPACVWRSAAWSATRTGRSPGSASARPPSTTAAGGQRRAAGPPGSRFVGGASLSVEDLLEDLAHARAHEIAARGFGVVVAASGPRRLARVEVVVRGRLVGHGRHRPAREGRRQRSRSAWSLDRDGRGHGP